MNQENKELFNARLLQFARYLESEDLLDHTDNRLRFVHFQDTQPTKNEMQRIVYHHWALVLLVNIFDEFYEGGDGDVYYETTEDFDDVVNGVFIYFGLESKEEFCSLFTINNKFQGYYKTKKLEHDSAANDIAYNIRQFVKARE